MASDKKIYYYECYLATYVGLPNIHVSLRTLVYFSSGLALCIGRKFHTAKEISLLGLYILIEK